MGALPRGLTKLMPGRKRLAERSPRAGIVHLFDGAGLLGQATLVDESATGARLNCFHPELFEAASFLLNARTGEAHRIELAWSGDTQFGVRYLRSTSVRVLVDPDFEHLKTYWATSQLGAMLR